MTPTRLVLPGVGRASVSRKHNGPHYLVGRPMSAELATLNSHHQRRLRATFQYIDNLLSEIDAILKPRDSGSLFPRYAVDFAPSQRVLLQSGIAEIRGRLLQAVKDYQIDVGPPSISAVQAIRSALSFIDIAVAELRPRYMRGYGAVPPEAAALLDRTIDQLDQLVHQLDAVMSHSQDLPDSPTDTP
jgi:hypothetical protein